MDTSDSITDSHQLVPKVQAGDRSSFARMSEALRPYLKKLVRQQLQGRLTEKFDESDIVQSALAKAVEGIHQFTGDTEEQWRAWLAEICRNETKNAIRYWLQARRSVQQEQEESCDPISEDQSTPSARMRRREKAERLLRAIESLNPQQQEMIQLRHFSDLSHEEIAGRLGISVDASRQRWHTTLKSLKKKLAAVAD